MAINNPIKLNDFYTYENWLDYFASRFKYEECFKKWLEGKEEFHNRYFIMNNPEIIYIFDKKTKLIHEFRKDNKGFVIDLKKMRDKKIFKFRQFELIKKVEE